MTATQPGLTVQWRVHFTQPRRGRKQMVMGDEPPAPPPPPPPVGRVARVARVLALAFRFEGLLARGEVRDYAELARLGHVTRARMTQIMNLLNLAPDIQEAILSLPPTTCGRDPIKEWQLREIAAEPAWPKQRRMWRHVSAALRTY